MIDFLRFTDVTTGHHLLVNVDHISSVQARWVTDTAGTKVIGSKVTTRLGQELAVQETVEEITDMILKGAAE